MSKEKEVPVNAEFKNDLKRDPITGAPEGHPVGTGVGVVVGAAAAGAAAGTVVGPIGTAVGAAVGAVVGAVAGQKIAEAIDSDSEVVYWRDNFHARPYVKNSPSFDASFDNYGPAYAYGVNAYSKYPGRSFDEVESRLSRGWNKARGNSHLTWAQARDAVRDAWDRLGNR